MKKLWCKLSYEAEFELDEAFYELINEGYSLDEAMIIFKDDIESSIIDHIDTRADNKFWVPYKKNLEFEWRDE